MNRLYKVIRRGINKKIDKNFIERKISEYNGTNQSIGQFSDNPFEVFDT